MKHPNTPAGDVAYWGLTHLQELRYLGRITRKSNAVGIEYAQKRIRAERRTRIVVYVAGGIVLGSWALRLTAWLVTR